MAERHIVLSETQRNRAALAFDRERQAFLRALGRFAQSRGIDRHDVWTEIAATQRAMDGILATHEGR